MRIVRLRSLQALAQACDLLTLKLVRHLRHLRQRRTFGPEHPDLPCCFMSPASCPAASPVPQNRSARTSPAIAPPVSLSCHRANQRGAVRSGGG